MPKYSRNKFYERKYVDTSYRQNRSLGLPMPNYRHIAYRSRYGVRPYLPPLITAAVRGVSGRDYQRQIRRGRNKLPPNVNRLISEYVG